MVGIKGDAEGRVVADAEAQLLRGGFGVCDRQGVVDGLPLQPEGASEDKIEGEALGLDRIVRAQFQLDGVALGAEQSVLQIPCKAVLAALVGLAVMGEGAAGQFARPGEEDGCMTLPDRRVGLPEQLFARCVLQADGLRAKGVHGQGQKFVVDGCLHDSFSFFIVIG